MNSFSKRLFHTSIFKNYSPNNKLKCPSCNKPNILTSRKCGSCEHPLSLKNISEYDPNIFQKIISKEIIHEIYYEDEQILIFKDKFPISPYHLICIPKIVIKDIRQLSSHDLNLIIKMYSKGVQTLKEMNIPEFENKNLEEFLTSGFNLPVSVEHLHLHLVLPPFTHTNGFKKPRFHEYQKVIKDLKKFGHVITNYEIGNFNFLEELYDTKIRNNLPICDNAI